MQQKRVNEPNPILDQSPKEEEAPVEHEEDFGICVVSESAPTADTSGVAPGLRHEHEHVASTAGSEEEPVASSEGDVGDLAAMLRSLKS